MAFRVRMSDEEVTRRIRSVDENRLTTLIGYAGKSGNNLKAVFLCTCGNTHTAQVWNVINGKTLSCGCRKPANSGVSRVDPEARAHHPYVATYYGMKARCLHENHKDFRFYGGRGIRVCDRWMADFWEFVADMGEKPTPEHTLDRIDTNGNYEPGNCRWATMSEQLRNRRPYKRSSSKC